MYKIFITLRYLRARPISYIATLVLALGVGVLLIVTSVMGGFQREFHKKIRGTLADVSVESTTFFGIENGADMIARVSEAPHVVAVAPQVKTIVLIDTLMTRDYGFLTGIDVEREKKIGEFSQYVLSPREAFEVAFEQYPELKKGTRYQAQLKKRSAVKPIPEEIIADTRSGYPGVIVGAELYAYLELRTPGVDPSGIAVPGDLITLLSHGGNELDPTQLREEDARKAKFEVVGVFKTGMFEQDKRFLIADLKAVQEFLAVGERLSSLNVKLEDYTMATDVAEDLKRILVNDSVMVYPWDKRNENLIKAVKIEQFMIYFIVFFMIVLIGLNLTFILTMSVIEKTKDLGILASVGATRWGRFSIFLWQGGIIGTAGALIGTGVGLLFVHYINEIDRYVVAKLFGKRIFDPSVYYIDTIPSEVSPFMVVVCVVPTILLGFALSLYPAWRAARLDPIEALCAHE